ncbi:MAG: phosphopyruvate hydratase [Acidobacteria bacterium]|nr:phosphopyruvate hydratase [Acidobacteriota bacterium]
MKIQELKAWEILDSRGRPTVAVEARLADGATGQAMVPSGASTGTHEAVELRDGDPQRYAGKGVLRAVSHVTGEIAAAVKGMDAHRQSALDRRMIELDGTPNKGRLGANAILGVSCAVARAAAASSGIPLWLHLAAGRTASLPVPMVNILSGGHHASHNIEFQDFLALPHGFATFAEAIHAAAAVHKAAYDLIVEAGYTLTGVADEGGWGPLLRSNVEALDLLSKAIERAGYRPGEQVSIALDVASSHFYRDGRYHLRSEGRILSGEEMVEQLVDWSTRYPVISIEDGLAEDDWDHWPRLTKALGDHVQLIGDDFFTTNAVRVRRGIAERSANAVLVKMNQIGTLTETLDVTDLALGAGWRAVISARSGETEDAFLSDLAVASGAGQIKVGSITRSERLAKWNRLLELEAKGGLTLQPFGV